jgi:hypothetical protein
MRECLAVLVLGAVAVTLVVMDASPALADGKVRNGRRFCSTPVRTADWWTPPQTLFGITFAVAQSVDLSCRRSNALVVGWLAKGTASLPHSRTGWSCQVTHTFGTSVGCHRGRRSTVFFSLAMRFRASLNVKTDGCAAEGVNNSQADRPVTFTWDYGGPGDYNPDVNSSILGDPWVYEQAGTYTATLTMRDTAGQTASATRSVTVHDDPRIPCGSGGIHDTP